MAADDYYRANSPDVLHETIEGEVVLVNMKSGAYYSIDRVGARIWALLTEGTSANRIVDTLAATYEGDRDMIANGVEQLLDQFREEGLVVPDRQIRTDDRPQESAPVGEQEGRTVFAVPVLHKYTDMQELLLLDPIHEVDETGWPKAKPTQTDSPPSG